MNDLNEHKVISFKSVGLKGFFLLLLGSGLLLLIIFSSVAIFLPKMNVPMYSDTIQSNQTEFEISNLAIQPIILEVGHTYTTKGSGFQVYIQGKEPLPYNIYIYSIDGDEVYKRHGLIRETQGVPIKDSTLTFTDIHQVPLEPGRYRIDVESEESVFYTIEQISIYESTLTASILLVVFGVILIILWMILAAYYYRKRVIEQLIVIQVEKDQSLYKMVNDLREERGLSQQAIPPRKNTLTPRESTLKRTNKLGGVILVSFFIILSTIFVGSKVYDNLDTEPLPDPISYEGKEYVIFNYTLDVPSFSYNNVPIKVHLYNDGSIMAEGEKIKIDFNGPCASRDKYNWSGGNISVHEWKTRTIHMTTSCSLVSITGIDVYYDGELPDRNGYHIIEN